MNKFFQIIKDLGPWYTLYAIAYFYEHREEADYKALTISLRALLFGSRKEEF